MTDVNGFSKIANIKDEWGSWRNPHSILHPSHRSRTLSVKGKHISQTSKGKTLLEALVSCFRILRGQTIFSRSTKGLPHRTCFCDLKRVRSYHRKGPTEVTRRESGTLKGERRVEARLIETAPLTLQYPSRHPIPQFEASPARSFPQLSPSCVPHRLRTTLKRYDHIAHRVEEP